MDSIGAQLRQERENRSMSFEEVAESTKITVGNLTAIEDDRFEFFPNRVYARAFIRDYANFLGLDSAALLEQYEQQRGEMSEVTEPVPVEVRIAPKRRWRAVGFAALVLGIVAGLALVAFVGWRLYDESLEISKPNPPRHELARVEIPTKPPEPALPEPEAAMVPSPTVAAAPAEPVQPVPAQPTEPAQPAPSDGVTIKLTALGNVWVSVKVDGQTKLYTTIPAGTTQTFEGRKKIEIRAGRASAVRIERDGKSEMLGQKSVPKTVVYTPKKPAESPAQ